MTTEPTNDPGPALHADTVAIRSGRVGDATSLAPVLWPTSTFVSPSVDDARRMATTVGADRFYSRYGNPTVQMFEERLRLMEGAEAAFATASGMAAISTTLTSLSSPRLASGFHGMPIVKLLICVGFAARSPRVVNTRTWEGWRSAGPESRPACAGAAFARAGASGPPVICCTLWGPLGAACGALCWAALAEALACAGGLAVKAIPPVSLVAGFSALALSAGCC